MYLFFIRQFNDIDHITPLVWKMRHDGHPVSVYCLNPAYDLRNDYRLSFLHDCGIRVAYVYDEILSSLGWHHWTLRWTSKCCYAISNQLNRLSEDISTAPAALARRKTYKWAKKLFNRSKNRYYTDAWALALLKKTGAQALCFDHINPGRHVVGVLLNAARRQSIPTFALPHGVFIYTNKEVRTGTTQDSRFDKFNHFDYVVTQNTLRKNVLTRAGVNSDKIHVLGSVRYSDEWMAENKSILPRQMDTALANRPGLKAVFMTTRFAYKINVDRMLKTIELLAARAHLHLLVKPHTRSGSEASVYDNLSASNVSNLSSVELCEWADVVLVIGSSILIEALKLDKPVLYLKYLHANTTQYEEMEACWTIHNEQELLGAIESLKDNPKSVPYSKESVDAFLAEIVYGGGEKRDVLSVYQDFITTRSV
ncbi:MAG: hypothetical protein PVF97_07295 [Desulfobacterales bacterium]|jgi:hypothetical protein